MFRLLSLSLVFLLLSSQPAQAMSGCIPYSECINGQINQCVSCFGNDSCASTGESCGNQQDDHFSWLLESTLEENEEFVTSGVGRTFAQAEREMENNAALACEETEPVITKGPFYFDVGTFKAVRAFFQCR